MYNKKRSVFVRLVAVILLIALVAPVGASAAVNETVQPNASSYLSSYNAYVYAAGSGKIKVYFNVQGTGTIDELGVLFIKIYESTDNSTWTWKKTFSHDSTSGMLCYNDNYHSGSVSYSGTAGRYYRAYVCVWGGDGGSGDTRYFYTASKKAT